MHLHHPSLSMTGKKKSKKKFASAAAKQQFLELESGWKSKQQEWEKLSKPTAKASTKITPNKTNSTVEASATSIKSLNSWVTGAVSSKPNPVYTGTEVIGIAVMHKSCLQPIFNKTAVIEVAKMRRG